MLTRRSMTTTCAAFAITVLTAGTAFAGGYDVVWSTIDGGGGTSTGGNYTLSGTLGQFEVKEPTLLGGDYLHMPGYWTFDGEIDPCPADVDDSGSVGFGDLTAMLNDWGSCPGCAADIDGNGTVGFSDLSQLLNAWGACL